MKFILQKVTPRILLCILLQLCLKATADAQTPPAIGYMYPPGGQAGQTVDVVLGGYDWTPDMDLFVHDDRIKLEMLSPPGPVIVPEPPYWFGKKARRPPFLLPREIKARLTIPPGISPGIVRWQAANANGATASGHFVVSDISEVIESDKLQPQHLPTIPVIVSGQIKHIEEVDSYLISASKSGPITCIIEARKIGSPLNTMLAVHDMAGHRIAGVVDTAGNDSAVTFNAKANESYIIKVSDVDFRGNRSFVYRLFVTAAPHVVAAIPAAGRRGETRQVKFVGYGIKTGLAKLESVTKKVNFPGDKAINSFTYHLETPYGTAPGFSMLVSDFPETVETTPVLSIPSAVTGALTERFSQDIYQAVGKKGDRWSINLIAEKIRSPLDVELTVLDASGKVLAQNDDVPGSTDAALEFTVPSDGSYKLRVSEVSGNSGHPAAVYRLSIETNKYDFALSVPELLNAPIGQKAKLTVKATRYGGFNDSIFISLKHLPSHVTVPANLEIPAGKTTQNIQLDVPQDAPATSALVSVSGEATIEGRKIHRKTTNPLLVATTIKPPFSIDAEGKDDVTKWPRGTTFPAPVLIQRNEDFHGEIILEMTSRQGRHRQGIRGPDLPVPPDVQRILYPVFLPEWLETTRTSRMVVNGVAKISDPQGKVRYSLTRQKTRMGFLPTGALMKISADMREFKSHFGGKLKIPITIRRSRDLVESIRMELVSAESELSVFQGDVLDIPNDQSQVFFPVALGRVPATKGEYKLTIRATLLKEGKYPVISETTVIVQLSQ